MSQRSLFDETTAEETVEKSPICSYQKHCGSKAAIGPAEDRGTCVNYSIRCLKCNATGVRSVSKVSK